MLIGSGGWTLSGYIFSIACLSAAIGIACAAAPEGIGGGLKKHLRLVCALCFLCVLIGPLTEIIDNVKSSFEALEEGVDDESDEIREKYESIYEEYLEGGYGDNVERAVKDLLSTRFGMPEEECRAEIEFADKNGDGVKEVTKITVILSGRSIFRDPAEIKSCVSECFDCECLCAIE